ncbi:hypothetical protein [Flavobacterium sp. HTF]|uniref:hypothetical protein n=1 Tax=Flavobacterium sp. HTF TaxID=2170732 RepID=UPI000D5C715F|nr:hypothetical protein [Flavobacterium sp. HTF]PWB25172.1 hypothetical protein DCO46_09685 [Flavobacterium sp. HTF]
MLNNTREDYKEAIRIKFEKEKNGSNSNFFNPPSQANLRDLCWKIFTSDPSSDDLKVYYDFFKSKFDSNNEDTSTVHTDKFKKVGDFLKRKKEPLKFDTVNLAAILVDFKLRPYKQFFEKGGIVEEQQFDNSPDREITEKDKKNQQSNGYSPNYDEQKSKSKKAQFKNKFYGRLFKRSKRTIVATIFLFGLIGSVICFTVFKKHCMQWSDDHYEIVDCGKPIKGNLNEVIQIDDNLLSLRKIPVCDTSRCFKPDGEAIVWYTKSNKKVDFFNSYGNGKHPENKSAMRPISNHIFKTYKKKDCASK